MDDLRVKTCKKHGSLEQFCVECRQERENIKVIEEIVIKSDEASSIPLEHIHECTVCSAQYQCTSDYCHSTFYIDHKDCAQEEEKETENPETIPILEVPYYYLSNSGDMDIYDFFIKYYGPESWAEHVLMEAVQYILRAPKKGSYEGDLRKAIVILERVIHERKK